MKSTTVSRGQAAVAEPTAYRPNDGDNTGLIGFFHVVKSFAPGPVIFRDVTFTVQKGDFLLLSGPSGSGKTVFIRMLLRLEPVSDGQIWIGNRNIRHLDLKALNALRRKIGVVFQDPRLMLDKTVFENTALPLIVAGRRPAFIRDRVQRILNRVGLDRLTNVPCGALSSCDHRLVAIARALVHDPVLLLADEPALLPDDAVKERAIELFERFHMAGGTTVVATNDRSWARAIPDCRSMVIQDKRIVEPSVDPAGAVS